MSISKIKEFIKRKKIEFLSFGKDVFVLAIIVLSSFGSFALGRASNLKKELLYVERGGGITNEMLIPVTKDSSKDSVSTAISSGAIVASKSGSKYHFPWCAGARSIKEENKIWFASVNEAKAAGYTPAANCKGLK